MFSLFHDIILDNYLVEQLVYFLRLLSLIAPLNEQWFEMEGLVRA